MQLDMFPAPQSAPAVTPADLLRMARGMMERAQADLISSWDAVLAYCHAKHGNPRAEVFRCLFLDRKNRLIRDKVMGEGTIDHVPVYPREVMREALLCDASALVLIHNHPSGDPTPSQADVAMTEQLRDACRLFGITLHDHVIIGTEREFSMMANGLLH